MGRILGLDFGKKRIGIAISDENSIIANGLKVIETENISILKDIVEEMEVKKIVVGLPIREDGSMGKEVEEVLIFINEIEALLHVPVTTWDERFSTKAASRVLIDGNVSRKKRKKTVDKLAATFILQGYLDSIRGEK
jgi:putative Holliday junction resolvase